MDSVSWQTLFSTFAQDTPSTALLFTVEGVFYLYQYHISQIIEVAISFAQMAGFDSLLLYLALAPVTAKLA